MSETADNPRAKILADALDEATSQLLESGKSPSRKVNELDNRGSHFYLALYWARALAEQSDDVPEDLLEQVKTAEERVREIGQEINRFSGARRSSSMERSTTRPSADQLWELERAWEKIPGLISELNGYITDTVPGIYRRLNELGILPDPGKPIVVPNRR